MTPHILTFFLSLIVLSPGVAHASVSASPYNAATPSGTAPGIILSQSTDPDTHGAVTRETPTITLTVVGGIILVKKAGALVFTLGKGIAYVGGVAGGLETMGITDIKKYFQNNKEAVTRFVDMSYDTLYSFCHDHGGGMVSTTDVTRNAWGDSYIFGVPEKNAVCISN